MSESHSRPSSLLRHGTSRLSQCFVRQGTPCLSSRIPARHTKPTDPGVNKHVQVKPRTAILPDNNVRHCYSASNNERINLLSDTVGHVLKHSPKEKVATKRGTVLSSINCANLTIAMCLNSSSRSSSDHQSVIVLLDVDFAGQTSIFNPRRRYYAR